MDEAHAEPPVSSTVQEGPTEPLVTTPSLGGSRLHRVGLWLRLRCGMEPRTVVAVVVVLLVAVGFAVHHFWSARPRPVTAPSSLPDEGSSPSGEAAPAASGAPPSGAEGAGGPSGSAAGGPVTVDVSGKVRKPGVLRLPAGSRVQDALRAAGGLRPGTEAEGLNRARLLVDGEQIVAGAPAQEQAPSAGAASSGTSGAGGGGPSEGAGAGGSGGTISLNSATAEQLETLPGVGPALAQRILDYRQQQGGFSSVDQLQDVSGIGERRFADIQPGVVP